MTRWFLDTEFHEDGRIIDLISIALVSDDGREYYAHSSEYDPAQCSDWVKQNVLPHVSRMLTKSRAQIKAEILDLIGKEYPEFWAYYADYDWVVVCQLFGRMIDLPATWPMYCLDLKQFMDMRAISKFQLPEQKKDLHNALEDARWVRDSYLYIQNLQQQQLVGILRRLRTGEI